MTSIGRRVLLKSFAGLMLSAAFAMAPRLSVVHAETISFPVSRLTIATAQGRHGFTVEVADTIDRRVQGLQHRRELAADAGMLFVFEQPQPASMWMKNTFISLDMLFIDENGGVVGVAENTEPHSLAVISSEESVAGGARSQCRHRGASRHKNREI